MKNLNSEEGVRSLEWWHIRGIINLQLETYSYYIIVMKIKSFPVCVYQHLLIVCHGCGPPLSGLEIICWINDVRQLILLCESLCFKCYLAEKELYSELKTACSSLNLLCQKLRLLPSFDIVIPFGVWKYENQSLPNKKKITCGVHSLCKLDCGILYQI